MTITLETGTTMHSMVLVLSCVLAQLQFPASIAVTVTSTALEIIVFPVGVGVVVFPAAKISQ